MHCSTRVVLIAVLASLGALADDSLVCKQELQAKVLSTFQASAEAFRQCTADSSYQIFPYPGAMPSTPQTQAICQSPSCAVLVDQIATFPDCELAETPLRRVGLVMNEVCTAYAHGQPLPPPRQIADRINNYTPPSPPAPSTSHRPSALRLNSVLELQ
uniref:Elicitin n=1 Tax=Achlya hypogyna TaxID=1202772 RepID=A0A0A7CMQ0_ACHHY|nr:secreted protein [Achlya hypogyna]